MPDEAETSIVMELAPELVNMDEMALNEEGILNRIRQHSNNYQHAEKIVNDELVVARLGQRDDVKVGVMGYPEKASPELGKKIVESLVKNTVERIKSLEAKADEVYKEVNFTLDPIILE